MAINVKLIKSEKVDSPTLLKKFTKKMQESGVIPKIKSKRFSLRTPAILKRRKDKLVRLDSAKKYEVMQKMGKLTMKPRFQRAEATLSSIQAKKEMRVNTVGVSSAEKVVDAK